MKVALEIREVVWDSATSLGELCDWINGRPGAWKDGYSGVAYPDIGGIAVPKPDDPNDHVYAQLHDWVLRYSDGCYVVLPREYVTPEFLRMRQIVEADPFE